MLDSNKFHEQLFYVLTRARPTNMIRESKAASLQQQPEMITICRKEYEDLKDKKCANVINQTIRKSMAASLQTRGINPAQLIHNFIFRH
jgi:hypothetical protein